MARQTLQPVSQPSAGILPTGGKAQAAESSAAPKQIGRPKKAAAEKRDYKTTLSLTKAEGRVVAEKAGLAGEATWLYDFLKKHGAFEPNQ